VVMLSTRPYGERIDRGRCSRQQRVVSAQRRTQFQGQRLMNLLVQQDEAWREPSRPQR
jgi:hypothetical protein